MKTTDIFNYFHDELKELIKDKPWMEKFCEVSGIDMDVAKACYWKNVEIPNDAMANEKLIEYISSLGYNYTNMELKISLSKSDLERIKDALSITSYDNIHSAFVDAMCDKLDRAEACSKNELEFTTINCDGEYRKWSLTVEELRNMYYAEDCVIPMGDDPVVEFEMAGIPMYVTKFDDIITLLGIDQSN